MTSQTKKTLISFVIISIFAIGVYFVLHLNTSTTHLETESQFLSNGNPFEETTDINPLGEVEQTSPMSLIQKFPQLAGVGLGIWPDGIGRNLTFKTEFFAENVPATQWMHENTDLSSNYYFLLSLIAYDDSHITYDTLKIVDFRISQSCEGAFVASVDYNDNGDVDQIYKAWEVDFSKKKFYEVKDLTMVTCSNINWGEGL